MTQDERFARYQWCGDAVWHTQPQHPAGDDADWTGYGAPVATPDEAAHLFDYELSAYSGDNVYADGKQMVSIIRR